MPGMVEVSTESLAMKVPPALYDLLPLQLDKTWTQACGGLDAKPERDGSNLFHVVIRHIAGKYQVGLSNDAAFSRGERPTPKASNIGLLYEMQDGIGNGDNFLVLERWVHTKAWCGMAMDHLGAAGGDPAYPNPFFKQVVNDSGIDGKRLDEMTAKDLAKLLRVILRNLIAAETLHAMQLWFSEELAFMTEATTNGGSGQDIEQVTQKISDGASAPSNKVSIQAKTGVRISGEDLAGSRSSCKLSKQQGKDRSKQAKKAKQESPLKQVHEARNDQKARSVQGSNTRDKFQLSKNTATQSKTVQAPNSTFPPTDTLPPERPKPEPKPSVEKQAMIGSMLPPTRMVAPTREPSPTPKSRSRPLPARRVAGRRRPMARTALLRRKRGLVWGPLANGAGRQGIQGSRVFELD